MNPQGEVLDGAAGGGGWNRRAILVAAAIAGVVIATAAILLAMGRVPICACGYVKLWEGDPAGPGNSQHLADWYTFSHLIHGFLFYAAGRLALRSRPFGIRLLAATVLECLWEIAENTDAVIQRYRAATVSLHYYGDSVLNSASDIGAMLLGFLVAARLPAWATVLLALGFELVTAAIIRDNLALNVLMLVYPLDAVRAWQAGG